MNNTTATRTTAHLPLIVEMTRELCSMENTMVTADQGLKRSLNRSHKALSDARLRTVMQAMKDGISSGVLLFICQQASGWQLQDLRCDATNDTQVMAMVEQMQAAVEGPIVIDYWQSIGR